MARIVKEPEERKNELIDIAEQLFIAHGYEQTAISDIVREANVSQGAFYYYFESKEDVLVAVIEKKIALMENDFLLIAERSDLDEAAKLNSMINSFICISTSGKECCIAKEADEGEPFCQDCSYNGQGNLLRMRKGSLRCASPLGDLLPPPHDDRIRLPYVLSE